MYGLKKEYYGVPIIFYGFNLALEIPTVFIDAFPPKKLFDYYAEKYLKEKGVQLIFNYVNFDIKVNKRSLVCRVNPTAWYPHVSHKKGGNIRIKNDIKKISKQFKLFNPHGMVTWRDDIPKYYVDGFKSLPYGTVEGSNILRDCYLLFVIGTYQHHKKELKKEFYALFPDVEKNLKLSNKDPKTGLEFEGELFNTFYKAKSEHKVRT